MPNILAHNHISAQVYGSESTDIMLGSTLPDFLGMYNARFGEKYGRAVLSFASPSVEFGAGFHVLTDMTYDAQPELPEMTEPLREALVAAGISYRAARLTTAFAADILVDRALLDIDAARGNFDIVRELAMHHDLPVQRSFDDRLTEYIHRYLAGYAPCDYRDPSRIAHMAQHRLRSRGNDPDKRITTEQLPAVTKVLSEHADRVGELGLKAVFGTIQELNAPINEAQLSQEQLDELSRRVKQATIFERAWRPAKQSSEHEATEVRTHG